MGGSQSAKKARTNNRSDKDRNAYRRRHIIPVPEQPVVISLLSNDIRRQYTLMFINTLNSQDFSLFFKFLTKYTSPDFSFAQTFDCSVGGNRHPSLVQLNGVQSATQYWFNKLQLLPDASYNLKETRVHTYPGSEESKVVGDMTASATYIYDVNHGCLIHMGSATYECGGVQNEQGGLVGSKRDRSGWCGEPSGYTLS